MSLLTFTPTQLQRIRGDQRQTLIRHLRTWEEHATLLRYVEFWLGNQPTLATLRQLRAETLLALGDAPAALGELDTLDKERGATSGRQHLRAEALITLGEWAEALAALDAIEQPGAATERLRAAWWEGQGAHEQAAAGYAALLQDLAANSSVVSYAARWALRQAQPQQALDWLLTRYQLMPGLPPRPVELRLEREAAEQLGLAGEVDRIERALASLLDVQQALVLQALGLETTPGSTPTFDAPQAIEEVRDAAPVPPAAYALLQEHWGYQDFRGEQAAVVGELLAGRNTLAVLPTGAGKSLCYQLPAFLLPGATVVVSPLIALMKDQLDGLPPSLRPQAVAINSTLRGDEVAEIIRQMRAGHYKLVYVAPERLRQQTFVAALREAGIARFVVDEAHCVSLWGITFRPDYLFLKRVLATLEQPPVLALTATATPETRDEIRSQLGDLRLIRASVYRQNLHFGVVEVPNSREKQAALVKLCKQTAATDAIVVYARSRKSCEELAALLNENGIQAAHYHAQIENRAAVQDQFMRGAVRVLVATVAFGMGVDKADVRMIVHYNLPQSVEAYYQEAGRAGRDGETAQCILLYTSSDKGQLSMWLSQESLSKDDLRNVYKQLRQHAQHNVVALHPDILLRDLPFLDETRLRVILGMLERVGLVLRHYDLPRTMSLTLHHAPDDELWAQFAAATYARPGQRVAFDPLETAQACDVLPDKLEAHLLDWQRVGAITYQGIATDLLLELLPAPPDTPKLIDSILRYYDDRQQARVAAMVGYGEGLNCRHRALAAHFDERLDACGAHCDQCDGSHTARRATQKTANTTPLRAAVPALHGPAVAEAILRTVRDLRYPMGRTKLVYLLVGSSQSTLNADRCATWGMLGGYSQNTVTDMIEALVQHGLLERTSDELPVLVLSAAGHSALLKPANLPDLAPAPSTSTVVTMFDTDDPLYLALAHWRRSEAEEQGMPLYIVFDNKTLHAIAQTRPKSLAMLNAIKGVGPRKLEQYGEAVLRVVAEIG